MHLVLVTFISIISHLDELLFIASGNFVDFDKENAHCIQGQIN